MNTIDAPPSAQAAAHDVAVDAHASAPASPPAPPTNARAAASRAPVLRTLLLLALVLPLIGAFAEWQDFRRSDVLLGRKDWDRGEVSLVWLFYFKTQLVLLPGLLLALGVAARRWANAAQALLLLWLMAVLTWAAIEVQVYTRTHVHVMDYARFMVGPHALQWAGDLRMMSYSISKTLLWHGQWLLIGTLAVVAVLRFADWWGRRFAQDARRASRRFTAACAVLYAAALLGVAPAQYFYRDRISLQRTHALLPFNLTWSAPGLELVDTGKFAKPLNRLLEPHLRRTLPALDAGAPPDRDTRLPAAAPWPNVLLIVMESLRADSLSPDIMPQLHALASRSIHLRQHRSGARMTHLGLYSLLYARTPSFYAPTLLADVPPQACVTFAGSGYRTAYVAAAEHEGWLGMDRYLNRRFFDEVTMFASADWPAMDARALARAKDLLRDRPDGKPQFVMTFLVSTHFPYLYPPQFETRSPVSDKGWHLVPFEQGRDVAPIVNRYRNACSHLDHAVAEFLAGIDLTNTVVAITGDHGESLWDDGALAHGGRWSDAQMRVPCLILGAGVEPRVVDGPTNHMDLLPTLLHLAGGQHVPLRNANGVDLLTRQPRSPCEVLSSESEEGYYEMLLMIGGRRMLFEFRSNRPEALVRGTVDARGRIDAFDLPPPEEAKLWADGIRHHLDRLSELRAPSPSPSP